MLKVGYKEMEKVDTRRWRRLIQGDGEGWIQGLEHRRQSRLDTRRWRRLIQGDGEGWIPGDGEG